MPKAPATTTAPSAQPAWRKNQTPIALGLAILLVFGAYLITKDDKSAGPANATGELFLEPAAATGPDPFTADITPPPAPTGTPDAFPTFEASPSSTDTPSDAPSGTTSPDATATAVHTTIGTNPGLYGGTRDNAVCDKPQLLAFLKANPDKGRAWAGVQGIAFEALDTYFAELTPLRLRHDTRVKNHGFRNGVATPRQSVLQAGTAVLVDKLGVPRAKCGCGNPVDEPEPVTRSAKTTGTPWPGYSAEKTVAIKPGPAPVEKFVVADPVTGQVFEVDAGSDGVAPSAQPSPPSSQFDPGAPCSAGPNSALITSSGTVAASSEFNSQFPARLAVDGKLTTSWFSKGAADGASSTFTWTAQRLVCVEDVEVFGNGRHPQFPHNFGFHAVRIELLGTGGTVVANETIAQPGTPDKGAKADFSKIATGIRLVWITHEAPNCGGFAELNVTGGFVATP